MSHPAAYPAPMGKPTEFWIWELDDERRPGKRVRTRWRMDAAEAAHYADRNPERVPGTCEVLELPETAAERVAQSAVMPAGRRTF